MENRSKRLVKNTAILSFGTLCTKGIMFLMTPLFTRWLSQSDYGIFDLIITYTALIIPLITLNCSEAVFRLLLDQNEEKKKNIVMNAIVIDLIGFLITLVIAITLSAINDAFRSIIVYFSILLVLEAINTFFTMLARGEKQLNLYTISNIIFVFSMVIFVTIFVKGLNWGLGGILLGYSMGYIFSIIFMAIKLKVKKYISLRNINKKAVKEMLNYSIPLIPNALSWWIVNVSDRTIVSIILGSSANAIIAVANKIPNLCQTIFNVFHLSWQENATETITDKDRDIYYTNIMNNMVLILVSICIVVLSGNFLIFKILFTQEYFPAYYQVPILIVSILISMLAQFIGGIYIAKKDSKKNGKTTVLAAIINIIVHLSLIKFIGIYAATISTLISYIVLFIIRYIDIKKTIDIKFKKSTVIALAILAYFFIATYINNLYLNCINLFFAILYFFVSNKNNLKIVLNKLNRRKEAN